MPEANDQGVGTVGLELVPKLIKDLVELGQVPGPDGWRGEHVKSGKEGGLGGGGEGKVGPPPPQAEAAAGFHREQRRESLPWSIPPAPLRASRSLKAQDVVARERVRAAATHRTLSQEEVGHERPLEGGLSELKPVRDLPKQQFHHDEQLVHLEQKETGESLQGPTLEAASLGTQEVPDPRSFPFLLTVCLKPTAVCCGAFRRAFVMVLRASEYSS